MLARKSTSRKNVSSRGWRSAPRDLPVADNATPEIVSAMTVAHTDYDVCGPLCDLSPTGRSLAVCAARDDNASRSCS
jgi:hypothetical protein